MFIKRNDCDILVALEVGTSKVIAAVAELRTDGTMTLLGVGEVPSSGIRKGEIVDFQDAQTCIHQALHNAEKETDAEIREVYLTLTGSHITSRTDMVRLTITDEEKLVAHEHVSELNHLAQSLVIPRDYVIVHSLLQRYCLDENVVSREPIGLSSSSLEGHYHLIYGLQTRLQTTVRCVHEQGVEICGYALSSYAMAQAILSPAAKQNGSVAIDMGAGITDYIVYVDGAVVHTGSVAVGGDHLTQDLAMGLRLPDQKAEQLKRQYGDLYMDGHHRDEKIVLERDMTFEERSLYRDSMVKILHVRQKELLSLIQQDLAARGLWPHLLGGVYITGGASQMRGVERMAREIFPADVKFAHEHTFDGDQTYSKRPDLSTVLGLLRYAQRKEMAKAKPRGWRRIQQSVVNILTAMRLL
ncbi:MAG: cell division protein FtsA [Verrucomicrobiota bacterium]